MIAQLLPTRPTFAPVAFFRHGWPFGSGRPLYGASTTLFDDVPSPIVNRHRCNSPRQRNEDVWHGSPASARRTGVVFPGTFARTKKETRLNMGSRLKPPAVDGTDGIDP